MTSLNTENTAVLSADQARTVLQFLQRTPLQGAEMAAYVDVFNALSAVANAAQGEPANKEAPQ